MSGQKRTIEVVDLTGEDERVEETKKSKGPVGVPPRALEENEMDAFYWKYKEAYGEFPGRFERLSYEQCVMCGIPFSELPFQWPVVETQQVTTLAGALEEMLEKDEREEAEREMQCIEKAVKREEAKEEAEEEETKQKWWEALLQMVDPEQERAIEEEHEVRSQSTPRCIIDDSDCSDDEEDDDEESEIDLEEEIQESEEEREERGEGQGEEEEGLDRSMTESEWEALYEAEEQRQREMFPNLFEEPQEVEQQGGSRNITTLYSFEELPARKRPNRNEMSRRELLLTFDPSIDSIPNVEEVYAACFIDVMTKVFRGADADMLVGMELDHPSWNDSFYFSYRPIAAFTTAFLREELTNHRQSARGIGAIDNKLRVTIVGIKRLRGSGRPTMGTIVNQTGGRPENCPEPRDANWRNVTKNRVAKNCLLHAVIQGIAYINLTASRNSANRRRWTAVCRADDRHPMHSREVRTEAEDLRQRAGITTQINFSMEHVEALQRHLYGEYQLMVINDNFDSDVVFRGPFAGRQNVLALLLKDGHYQFIKHLAKFFKNNFYCTMCDVRTHEARRHYTCPLRCRKCLREGCEEVVGERRRCQICTITFESQACFDAHNQRGPRGGRSRCSETKPCRLCHIPYYTDRKNNHTCGFSYCNRCHTEREAGHTCMMSPSTLNEKKITEKRIYYDLETMTVEENNRAYHRVVLAMALRCCSSCRDNVPTTLQESRELTCTSCSPDGQRFWSFDCVQSGNEDVDVMTVFGNWLVNKHHKGFTAVAHNMKGYDGQFILRHIFADGTPAPKALVCDGTKINFISIDGMRFLDSFNYVPAALSTFSKTFGIPEIVKGEFPFKFVRPENFDYEGPMPSRDEYGVDQRPEEKRIKFEQFYQERLNANQPFNFRRELLTYCCADVILLAAAMNKFEKSFREKTNVVLFEETVTSASAAVKTFRRNHLPLNTIVLDASLEGTSIKQSVIASRYLAWMQKTETENICTGDNVGEYQIPNTQYHVDGFIHRCVDYPNGIAIEIKGCFWHAHDCKYAAHKKMHSGLTAQQIRDRDAVREAIIETHCDLKVVYECQIDKERQSDRSLDEFLKKNHRQGPVIAAEALFGGRTEVIRMKMCPGNSVGKEMSYKDFTSLYPDVMKNCPYPVGAARAVHPRDIAVPIRSVDELTVQGIISCRVVPPQHKHIPVLPARHSGKLMFPLCTGCSVNGLGGAPCSHDVNERAILGTYTSFELNLALEEGYEILEVFGAMHWDNWRQYRKNGDEIDHGIFSEYVDCFLKLKQEASGYPATAATDVEKQAYIERYFEHEGIRMDAANISHDPVMRQVAKLLLNSLWGKLGQRTDRPQTHLVNNMSQVHVLLEDPTLEVRRIAEIGDSKILVVTRKMADCVEPLDTSAMPYAVFTTSHARCKLFRAVRSIPNPEENVLYMDTDSVIYAYPAGADPLASQTGEFLGQLTNELSHGSKMEEFVSVGPKSYSFKEVLADGRIKMHVKAKGFPKNGDMERKITMEAMKAQVDTLLRGEDPTSEEIVYERIERDREHRLFSRTQTKRFRLTFDKRKILPDGGTEPFGKL